MSIEQYIATEDNNKTLFQMNNIIRVWKGIHGVRECTKKGCGIRDLTAPGQRDLPKLGTGCGILIKKGSGMRDFHKKGRECEIRITPPPLPLPDPI